MKRSEERKAHRPVNGIFYISFILILSFVIFSAQVYGSTDIPVNDNTAPAAIGTAAGFGGGSGLTNQGIFTIGNAEIDTTAASTFVIAFHDEEAVYTETPLDTEPVNGAARTAHRECQDSCSL